MTLNSNGSIPGTLVCPSKHGWMSTTTTTMLWRRCSMPMSAGSKRCKNKNGHYIFQRLESEAQANMQKEQHVARYHQSLCRSNKRTIQMELMFASSQNSQFPTGTRTQGAGVDHRLMDQLFGPWRSPSQISE